MESSGRPDGLPGLARWTSFLDVLSRWVWQAPSGIWTSSSIAFTMARRSCKAALYNVFERPLLSLHAIVPVSFRLQVSTVTQGTFL